MRRSKSPMRRVSRVTAPLVALVLAGCYQSVPVSLDSVRPSERVRVSVSPQAAEALEEVVGVRQYSVSARLAGLEPDGVSLLVPSAFEVEGTRSRDLYQQVRLAPADVLGVQRLQLNRRRTTLLAATAAIATAAIAVQILSGETGSSPLSPGGGSAEVRLPF